MCKAICLYRTKRPRILYRNILGLKQIVMAIHIIYKGMCTHVHIRTHTQTDRHTHIHTHAHIHTRTHTHTYTYTHTYTHAYTHIHTYIHVHTHTYIHTYTHTYIHTTHLSKVTHTIHALFEYWDNQ